MSTVIDKGSVGSNWCYCFWGKEGDEARYRGRIERRVGRRHQQKIDYDGRTNFFVPYVNFCSLVKKITSDTSIFVYHRRKVLVTERFGSRRL